MDSPVLPMQLPIVALTKARWKPFCSCPFDEAVPGSLRCETMPLLDLWALRCDQYFRSIKPLCLVSAHIASHNSPAASCKCLNEPLGQLMINGFHSFQRYVYLNRALTHRTTGILSPVASKESLLSPPLICTPADC